MAKKDRTLTCSDCGSSFVFTVKDQDFYEERGFSEPRRCPGCRAARKASRTGDRPGEGRGGYSSGSRPERQMFDVVCARCGKPTQVPFQPRNDRPVYCRDCYEKQRQ
jgi:CxxC-x17-CxxC domain-containing protein